MLQGFQFSEGEVDGFSGTNHDLGRENEFANIDCCCPQFSGHLSGIIQRSSGCSNSLLQDYPIGSFLFWEVRDPKSKTDYKYYEFLREYREYYRTDNPEFNTEGHIDFDAVLDGQQRLTALYVGLCGTYAYYRGYVWRQDNEHAVPTRRLT